LDLDLDLLLSMLLQQLRELETFNSESLVLGY
jgi:hypothetical protein